MQSAADIGLPLITQGLFFILLLVSTIYSGFMIYHWFAYGASPQTSLRAAVTYLSVTVLCFAIMFISGF